MFVWMIIKYSSIIIDGDQIQNLNIINKYDYQTLSTGIASVTI